MEGVEFEKFRGHIQWGTLYTLLGIVNRGISLWNWAGKQEGSINELSGARESHPCALRELDVTVSRHPAPIVQP